MSKYEIISTQISITSKSFCQVKSHSAIFNITYKKNALKSRKKPADTTNVLISGQEKLLDLEDLLPQLNMYLRSK